jgi:DNA invertase Pin-like site-specific DNA recombinase
MLAREWNGRMHRVAVLVDGFAWNGKTYPSLSKIALAITGTRWNGPRFFGLARQGIEGDSIMKTGGSKQVRCAIYTRVSTDQGLEQDFNSLDAQYDASQAYIRSQAHAGWTLVRSKCDDGGFSGGNTDRPALQRLLEDLRAGKVDIIVVYKVDRLTRSLADFAKLVELFDQHGVSFVSVTQQFNTTTSMGRLILNVLLSFAQFEREVTSERIRDKIAASKRKGLWVDRGSRRKNCSRSLQRIDRHRERAPHPQTHCPRRRPIGPVGHRGCQRKRCRSQTEAKP